MSAPVLSWLFHALEKSRETFSKPPESSLVQSTSKCSLLLAATSISQETPRPNPQSQSLSRGYGSILPTSLIYIILSTRGYEPWRPDAVMSTIGGENNSRNWIFKGRPKRSDRSKINLLYQNHTLPLRAILFRRVYVCKKEKITLLRARASVSSFA